MNKKLFLVLFLALILVVGFVYAKNINQTVEKKASTTVLSKEDAKAVKTAPQVIEQAIPQEEVVKVARPVFPGLEGLDEAERHVTQEGALENAVIAPEEYEEVALMPLTGCFVRNDTGAYYYPTVAGSAYWFNSARKLATFIDPELKVLTGQVCAKPTYPFKVDSVFIQLYFLDSCHVPLAPEVYTADFSDPYCPYPGDLIATGPTITYVSKAGGFESIWMPFTTDVCVYDRFFAGVWQKDRAYKRGVTLADTSYVQKDSTCSFYGTQALCDSVWGWKYERWEYFDKKVDSTCSLKGTGAKCDDSTFTWKYKYYEYTVFDSTCALTGTGKVCDSTFEGWQYDTTYQLMYWEYFNKCVPPVIPGKDSCIVAINVLLWGYVDPVSQLCLYPWMPPFDSCAFEAETLWGHWEMDSSCTSPTPTAQYPLRPPCEVITIVDTIPVYKYLRWEYVPKDSVCSFTGTGAKCDDSVKVWTFKRWKYVTKPDSACTFTGAGVKCDSVQGWNYKWWLRDSTMVIDTITMSNTVRVMYSGLFDMRGQTCRGYLGPSAYGYHFYDLVSDFGFPGFQRIRVSGQTANTNTCPADTLWYEKPAVLDPPNKYAPCGVPDFSQYDHNYPKNGMAYCGPTAVANCFWWAANFWPSTSFRNFWGGWGTLAPPVLINTLAGYFQTDSITGTDIFDLQDGLDTLILEKSFFVSETTVVKPDWYYLQHELRLSQDVILLLGFYQKNQSGAWYRFGGHYVTMAGVNKGQWLIELSDPAADAAEMPGAGWVCSNGLYLPHVPHTPVTHDDAGNTSYDVYQAVTSSSPGGVVALPDYYHHVNVADFQGKNGAVTGTYNPDSTVYTEIEYAVVICPISALLTGLIFSYDFYMAKSNFGGEGVGDAYGWVWWASPYGYRTDLWEGGVIVGTNPNDLAVAVRLVGAPNYQPMSFYNLFDDPITWTNVYPTIDGDTAWSEYYSTNNTDLKVHMRAFGFYDEMNLGMKDGVIQEFTITNRGTSTIADVEWALIMDFDPGSNTLPLGVGDSLLNTGGIYETSTPRHIDYMTLVPTKPGITVPTFVCGEQNTWLYDDVPLGPYTMLDSVMNIGRWDVPVGPPPVFDYALLMVSKKVTLGPGDSAFQTYFMWSDSTKLEAPDPGALAANTAKQKLFAMLMWIGFFRGDVDGVHSGPQPNAADVIRLARYVILGEASMLPIPFAEQGDVDGVHTGPQPNAADVIRLARYVILGEADKVPLDFPRWGLQNFPQQPSLFLTPKWKP